jgi:Sec-independent protein translocase protein TatA
VDLFVLLIVILIVALVWRGPKTLPQIGAMFGRGLRDARREAEGIRTKVDQKLDGPDEKTEPPAT